MITIKIYTPKDFFRWLRKPSKDDAVFGFDAFIGAFKMKAEDKYMRNKDGLITETPLTLEDVNECIHEAGKQAIAEIACKYGGPVKSRYGFGGEIDGRNVHGYFGAYRK